ncbi:MAG: glycosyltransferase [Holophaga sp.]|nr:glycosyltransferase [Holophaga sp.]
MSFRPCLILPVYDPGPALVRTVAALSGCGLPMYLVDDGSSLETRRELQRMAADQPLIRLLSLSPNQGKGAAVMEALRRAGQDGFSHALQVDADDQHDVGAVAGFLALGRDHPGAVIAGVPRYDASVPAARKYWRYLSHFWVWVSTLSLDIRDSLCGFRLYPLAPTLALMAREHIRPRMEFDTEIIVRLHWAGVPVLNAPVGVTYPRDGVSHFRPWRDTLCLVWMHHRLFFGMLRRLPRLLAARPSRPWYRIRERGTRVGFRVMVWILRRLGPRGLRLAGGILVPYFFLTSGQARRASRDYLTRLRACSGPLPGLPGNPGLREVYRHFRSFGRAITDKVLAWSGCRPELASEDLEPFLALRRGGRGAVFLGAHLGNLEMLRALGQGRGLPGLNAVVYSENAVRFHELLARVNPAFGVNLVQVAAVSPDTAILLQEKVDRGECLFIVADRTPPSDRGRTVQAPFLGHDAAFPIGPFILAHLLHCPVYLMFCVHDGQRYRVRLEPFAESVELPRAGREAALAGWAGRYARGLEAQCRATPFEWFNFFDFWASR